MEEVKYMKMRVETANLFQEIVNNPSTSTLGLPLQIILNNLARIAQIAIENEYMDILDCLDTICIVRKNENE